MSKFADLKMIIKQDNSDNAANKFTKIISEHTDKGENLGMKQDQLDLLLRWTVQEQKKNFSVFYHQLKKMGANINFFDKGQKKSNLMIACQNGNVQIVQTLINDPDINFKHEDSRKKNCIFYAVENRAKQKGQKYIKMIIQRCPDILTAEKNAKRNNTPLVTAVQKGKIQIVKILLQLGADPNQRLSDNGNTPIYQAVKLMKMHITQNNKQIVKHLLEKGADPYIKNKQGKSALNVSEKYEQQIIDMYQSTNKKKVSPIYSVNTISEREQMFAEAAKIFSDLQYLIEISENSSQQSEFQENQDPYEDPSQFIHSLTDQIIQYAHVCQNHHQNAKRDLQKFMEMFNPISQKLDLHIQIYGSFATKLWLKHCDIDLLLIPKGRPIYDHVEGYLDQIYMMLLNASQGHRKFVASMLKTIKVPMIRVQMIQRQGNYWAKKSPRKFDITIMDNNHNGKQHVHYISQLMHCYPALQPLFYVVKKLSYTFKLNDPKQNGVRSYALILMLAYFLQQYQVELNNNSSLGQLLLNFFRKYGYLHQYDFVQNPDQHKCLILNLADPINIKNNVGNQTDAYSLQKMFRTAYIILHTKGFDNKLSLLFEARNMFGALSF